VFRGSKRSFTIPAGGKRGDGQRNFTRDGHGGEKQLIKKKNRKFEMKSKRPKGRNPKMVKADMKIKHQETKPSAILSKWGSLKPKRLRGEFTPSEKG